MIFILVYHQHVSSKVMTGFFLISGNFCCSIYHTSSIFPKHLTIRYPHMSAAVTYGEFMLDLDSSDNAHSDINAYRVNGKCYVY